MPASGRLVLLSRSSRDSVLTNFTFWQQMHPWNWGYEELRYFVFIHVPGESNCRWLRSLFLLCSCNIFQALINSFVSWFWKVSQLIFFGRNDHYCCFVLSHLWILLHDHFLECHQLLINFVDTYKSWGKCLGHGEGTNDVVEKKQGRRGRNYKHIFTHLMFTVMFLLSNTSGYGSEFQLCSYIINHHSSKRKKHANNLPSPEQAAKTQPKQDVFFFHLSLFLTVFLLFKCRFVAW